MRARELLVPVKMVLPEGATVKEVDEAIGRALRDVPSAIWQEYVKVIEKEAIDQSGGALRRKSSEMRRLRTSYGEVEFTRGRFYYADGREPGTVMVFDSRIDLTPRQRWTPGAQTTYARLAALAPSFKCASRIAELLFGEGPSDWWIWKRTRDEGRRLRERERLERKATFEDGELLNAEAPAKDFVGIEADGTKIHAWRQKGENHDLYMGIVYDGKERVSKGRNRLTNKVAACGLYSLDEFGKDLFVVAQKHHNVTEAKAVLFTSDGERGLETLRLNHFPHADHQLDWWHVGDKTREAYSWQRPDEIKRINNLIFSNNKAGFLRQLSSDRRRLKERRSKLDELSDYVLPRWEMLFASRHLTKRWPELILPKGLKGSGAQERNIATVVGHRMKWRGMGWSKQGAANIMRVRLDVLIFQD
jgi:hypothetical protein